MLGNVAATVAAGLDVVNTSAGLGVDDKEGVAGRTRLIAMAATSALATLAKITTGHVKVRE